jgi:hypothetical protein
MTHRCGIMEEEGTIIEGMTRGDGSTFVMGDRCSVQEKRKV